MNYFCIEIRPPHYLEHFSDEKMDILTALLSELPFDTFDSADDGACIRAYIPELDFTETVEAQLTTLSLDLNLRSNLLPTRTGINCGNRIFSLLSSMILLLVAPIFIRPPKVLFSIW
jgi:hypothetical protein